MSKASGGNRALRHLVAGLAALSILIAAPAGARSALQRLEIDTATGPHVFKVEVMATEAEREHGLMNRPAMPKDHGMLFDFHEEQPVSFWMKDTLIPLDMIFVAEDGHVINIKHDAKPMDKTLIDSGGPTLGVIELNAGEAEAIRLRIGDTVKHPIFKDGASAEVR